MRSWRRDAWVEIKKLPYIGDRPRPRPKPGQAKPPFGFWPCLSFCKAGAAQSQAKAGAFRPSWSRHITTDGTVMIILYPSVTTVTVCLIHVAANRIKKWSCPDSVAIILYYLFISINAQTIYFHLLLNYLKCPWPDQTISIFLFYTFTVADKQTHQICIPNYGSYHKLLEYLAYASIKLVYLFLLSYHLSIIKLHNHGHICRVCYLQALSTYYLSWDVSRLLYLLYHYN